MRHHTLVLGLLLPFAAAVSGCGVNSASLLASSASPVATPAAHSIHGKAFGGQQPVSGATIALYTFGATGYGSAGTLLASATTDAYGYFNIDPSQINCPSSDSPLYVLSLGGNPGNPNNQTNSAIALGAGLGTCANALNAFVTINEISTAMLAYTFSHFFSTTTSDGLTYDHFGAPADQPTVIGNGNSGTLTTLIDTTNGVPWPNSSTLTFEGAKLITVGNILAACVNTTGPADPACVALFAATQPASAAAPTNTLEAAIDLALNPAQNTAALFALQPSGSAAAFLGGLSAAPADWTLSASYTSPAFALAVTPRTVSTLDIDTTGRVWFPSDGATGGGVGYFDPAAGAFSQLFPGNLTHPQQIAIDHDNYVWVNDLASANIAGFPTASPSTPTLLSLAGSNSTALTIGLDNSPRYGIVAPNGTLALAQVTAKTAYAEVPNTEFPFSLGFIASSLAGDTTGGYAISGQSLYAALSYDLYDFSSQGVTTVAYQTSQDGGQVAFNGLTSVSARGGYTTGADGICLWSAQTCFPMANDAIRHPSGLAIDGSGSLWLADNNTPSVEQIPTSNGSYLNAASQANNTVFLHDAANGGTLVAPAGIAVDRAGNVWVSNASCNTANCTPGSFVLSEIIGAAAPTTTPVVRQILRGGHPGAQPTAKHQP